jgi:hypothetical protein
MRLFLVLIPSIIGFSLLTFNNENLDENVPTFVLQFVILSALSILTLSWIFNIMKSPFIKGAFLLLGLGNLILALYLFFKFWDGYVSLPFFLLSSWCFFKAN